MIESLWNQLKYYFKLLIKRKYVTLGRQSSYIGYIQEASWRIQNKNNDECTARDFLSILNEYANFREDEYVQQ